MNKHIAFSQLITVLSIILTLLIWQIMDILLLTFAAILLGLFLRRLNVFFKKFIHIPDKISISIVITLMFTLLIVLISILTPILSSQIQALSSDIPNAWKKVEQFLNSSLSLTPILSTNQNFDLNSFLIKNSFLMPASHIFSKSFGFIGNIFVIIFMGIFFTLDPNKYTKGFVRLFPLDSQKKVIAILNALSDILHRWMIGKFFSMLIVGVLTSIGLWLLNIPLALALGLLAAALTFIPNIGPIISAIPAILIAFVQDPLSAVYVIILYVFIQTIESYIITPLIQGKSTSLAPGLVIFFQLIMGVLTGFLGLALATPILAAISVIIPKLTKEKIK